MDRDPAATDRLRNLVAKIEALTKSRGLHWERQTGSAHRYARWNNNLLILGPSTPLSEDVTRYLFITPFDSPDCIEINSDDPELGAAIMNLVRAVEDATRNEPATDPFSVNDLILKRLEST